MNKMLYWARNILLVILTVLFTMSYFYLDLTRNANEDILVVILLFIILIGLLIKDFIRKESINYDNKFNLLIIIASLIMIFVYARGLFSTHFIYNSKEYMDILRSISNYPYELRNLNYYNAQYINQNNIYFIIILLSLIAYRSINKQKTESKYHIVSLICFYVSLASLYLSAGSLGTTSAGFIFGYFVFNVILVGIEIYRLIKDNHKKRDWIILVSFFFNLMAFISLFISTRILLYTWS